MIVTRFATVARLEWGCVVTFGDGLFCNAQHHPEDPHYRHVARRCGYGDDTLAYCIEHEVAHLVVEELLHDRPSRVLWGLAHLQPLHPFDSAYEEIAAQALQRWARGGEEPIVGPGIDWQAMRKRFLEVCDA